jgi:probable addiction module antidote protein
LEYEVEIYQSDDGHRPFIDWLESLSENGPMSKNAFPKFRDYHLEKLADPTDAKAYLEMALEELHREGDREGFLLALRDVAEAQGGLKTLMDRTDLKPTGLYKALSENGNPTLATLDKILGGLGFRLSIETA